MDIVSVKCEYSNVHNGEIVEVTAMNEIRPKDFCIELCNKNKPHTVMPLVEFIDGRGDWHILSLEDFMLNYKEV